MGTAAQESPANGAAWIAGEASGDYLASLVVPHLQEALGSDAPQFGVGGPKMADAGFDAWYGIERLSVMGYVEVIKKLPSILKLRRAMLSRVLAANPRVFIGVDAPDFNLPIETKLREHGIPTVHFVSPSIWAWRPERIHKIARAVDHMLLVFPFEEEIYKKAGIPATYIGHPLAGVIPMEPATFEARQRLGIDTHGEPLYAVLPGSRVSEVSGCGPIFFKACEYILERTGAGYFVLPALDEERAKEIDAVAQKFPAFYEKLTIVAGQSHRVLEASDGVMAASGTATLEAALFKKPLVVGYTMPGMTAWLMKKKGLISYVSLPNILSGRAVVPEFLHYYCRPDAIAASLIDQMRPESRSQLVDLFTAMHQSLLRPTGELAATAIESCMRERL